MTTKLTSLLAAALFAGTCSYALAQGAGGAAGGGGAAGSDISTPKLNSGPGGTASQNGPVKTKKVHMKKKKHHRHM